MKDRQEPNFNYDNEGPLRAAPAPPFRPQQGGMR